MMQPIRLAGADYALPQGSERVADVLAREAERVAAALAPLTAPLRRRVVEGLGLERVTVCRNGELIELLGEATRRALDQARVRPHEVDLVIDFTTLPAADDLYEPRSHRVSAMLGAERALNVNLKFAGCAGFHIAVKLATALMTADDRLRVALLAAADAAPAGSRSLLPITVQGDAASAVVLRRDVPGSNGPMLFDTEVLTLGHLWDAVLLDTRGRHVVVDVTSVRLEQDVLPIYYLHFHRLIHHLLGRANISLADVSHVIYSNVSAADRAGFSRALGFAPSRLFAPAMALTGHAFASDVVINYADVAATGRIKTGEWLLFASAGVGFSWGVTLARA